MPIELLGAGYSYFLPDGREIEALRPTTLTVAPGEFLAVVGANGSGKSTLGKLVSGLVAPTVGEVRVGGQAPATADGAGRRDVGIVWQNPDNQLVATIVEDDVAFGPENLCVAPTEIRARVVDALAKVGMSAFRAFDPHNLSAGQRQRVAIAGALAMRPRFLVLDEPTSMLDPAGRREVLEALLELKTRAAIGIIYITHIIEEAALAERVAVLNHGGVMAEGPPRDILSDLELVARAGLYLSRANRLAVALAKHGLPISTKLLTPREVAQAICSLS